MKDSTEVGIPLHLPCLLAAATTIFVLAAGLEAADKSKPAAAPAKPAAAAPKPAAPATTAGRGGAPGIAGRGATPAGRGPTSLAGRGGAPAGAGRGPAPGAAGRGPATANFRGAPPRPGERITRTPGGGEIHRGADGRIHEVHARGMEIHHGPGGSRTVIRERDGHVLVVSNHYGHGYIQHPYRYRDVEFVHRTYYVNGVAYVHVYRPYVYYGVPLNVYAPPVFYAPAFYGWVYNPWVAPVVYPWGWAGNPWFAYWGAYFTPYPAYANAALWLTDYYVAMTLQAAYLQQAAALANAQPAAAPAPLTPDVKQAIADEVRRQLALENAEAAGGAQAPPDPASSGVARMLADNTPHVFLVSAPLDLSSNAGECPVTEGDVLQLNPGTPPNAATANLMVMASKGADCVKGSTVTVGVADLQDMQNHMRETLDQGLGNLQKEQGQKGLPRAPQAAAAAPMQTAFAAAAPPPDPNVAAELSQQTKEADSAEREVLSQDASTPVAAAPSAPAAPAQLAAPPPPKPQPAATVDLAGKSPDEVKALLGEPIQPIIDVGTKKIMVFKDLKVTFTNGKVTSIQ